MKKYSLQKLPPFRSVKPIVLFIIGLSAFGWQVLFEETDRPYLLLFIAGMLGLPFSIVADKSRNKTSGGEDEDSKKSGV